MKKIFEAEGILVKKDQLRKNVTVDPAIYSVTIKDENQSFHFVKRDFVDTGEMILICEGAGDICITPMGGNNFKLFFVPRVCD
jgi:hypothetical protein